MADEAVLDRLPQLILPLKADLDIEPSGSWLRATVMDKLWKPLMRRAISKAAVFFRPMIAKKKNGGYVNPEALALEFCIHRMMEMDNIIWEENEKRLGKKDKNRQMWEDLRDSLCAFVDEDAHYLIRLLRLIDVLHTHYDMFNIPIHKGKAYWDWENLRRELIMKDEQRKAAETLKAEGWEDCTIRVQDDLTPPRG